MVAFNKTADNTVPSQGNGLCSASQTQPSPLDLQCSRLAGSKQCWSLRLKPHLPSQEVSLNPILLVPWSHKPVRPALAVAPSFSAFLIHAHPVGNSTPRPQAMWGVSKEPRRRSLPTQGNSDCLGVNDVISVGKSLFFFFLNKQKWPSAAWPPLFSKLPFCLLLIFGCKFHHLLNSLPPLLPFPISFVSSPLSAPCASPPVSPPGCLAWLPLHLCRNT